MIEHELGVGTYRDCHVPPGPCEEDEGVPEFALDFLIAKLQAFRGSRADGLAGRRTAGELHCRSQCDLDVTRRDLPVEMEGCYRSRFPSFPLFPVPPCSVNAPSQIVPR